jgi:predicted enzyme related to lactoylglutathione lyase
MFSFDSLGHINVVVSDLEEATHFYHAFFDASVEQTFRHFKEAESTTVRRRPLCMR